MNGIQSIQSVCWTDTRFSEHILYVHRQTRFYWNNFLVARNMNYLDKVSILSKGLNGLICQSFHPFLNIFDVRKFHIYLKSHTLWNLYHSFTVFRAFWFKSWKPVGLCQAKAFCYRVCSLLFSNVNTIAYLFHLANCECDLNLKKKVFSMTHTLFSWNWNQKNRAQFIKTFFQ